MTISMTIYLAIAAAILGLTVWRLLAAERPTSQATAAMVVVPLLLRLLLVN